MVTYPARVQLVAAANPCPCAKPGGDLFCECAPGVRLRYLNRLSGPLMDRIDVQVRLLPVTSANLFGSEAGEPSDVVAKRVVAAREAAVRRWHPHGWTANSQALQPALLLPASATADLRHLVDAGLLSARGFVRVLRIAWTVADLAGRDRPTTDDVNTALYLRLG
jgi:magnesium chelatase family protein